ncbi:MAG: uroporphyrinogen-III synthase [Chitinophagales bacterium]|nr:uroporphyrinogen-III synthase [Chitinophagales bacterium]
MRILSTKPLSADELEFAASQGAEVQCIEVIRTEPLAFQLPDANTYDAVVFTSANALRYFFRNDNAAAALAGKTIFSIGGKTEQHLNVKGFAPQLTAYNGEQLADKIIASATSQAVLHPCSSIRLPILEQKFKSAGIAYTSLPVYHTSLLSNVKAEGDYDVILFFSPSGVESFLAENKLPQNVVCSCIGNTTAGYLKEKVADAEVIIPAVPTAKEMLQLAVNHLRTEKKI